MSPFQHARQADLKLPLQCAKNTTDTKGMQAMFERYTSHLPKTSNIAPASKSPKALAVIGSTGFLGPHIIASLLSVHKHSDIFCLNRSSDARQRTESPLQQLVSDFSKHSSRLHFWVMDMTQPNFGLAAFQAGLLASQVDELIFNAWDPHWGKDLAYFDPFLEGIRTAIDFCASSCRRPRLSFVSSICAVGDWPLIHPTDPAIPEAVVWDDRCAMTSGYGQSKCVAEQVLAKAHEVSGIPVSVFRAGQIGGPSRPDMGPWPRQGWLCSIIISSKRLKVFPTHVTPLDWIPVDIFADGIANSTLRCPTSSDVEVFNAVHPKVATWDLFYKTLRSRFNLQAAEESLQDWLHRSDPTDMKLHGFLTAMEGGREYNMIAHNQKALEVLPSVPEITEKLLAGWLASWKLKLGDLSAKL
jgi:thioester reductase-like protein